MELISTRGQSKVTFSEAVQMGMAADGGLFVPTKWPRLLKSDFKDNSFSGIAFVVLKAFLGQVLTDGALKKIIDQAFYFPIPLVDLDEQTSILELYHGPTAAFKDIAARFLAGYMESAIQQEQTILVATSGDTGGAIASAFEQSKKFRIIIFFPKDGVSQLQRQQLTCWGKNITSVAVNGSFDDCQSLVKKNLMDPKLSSYLLTSANSINIARILPQICYHAAAAIWNDKKTSDVSNLIIPSGNLGNAVAAFWARKIGLPIKFIGMATNKNKVLLDYYESGIFSASKSEASLANAMDVGHPSNFERLTHLIGSLKDLKAISEVQSFSDNQIKSLIRLANQKWNRHFCPHTATALGFRESKKEENWIIYETAHQAKFSETVEAILGTKVTMPENLKEIYSRKSVFSEIDPNDSIIPLINQNGGL